MPVRSNIDSALDEELTEDKVEWEDDNDESDAQVRLDRHALVTHGKQIAVVQEQLTQVVAEMGSLRRLCLSARNNAKKTNLMLETLGKHLGVELDTEDGDGDGDGDGEETS